MTKTQLVNRFVVIRYDIILLYSDRIRYYTRFSNIIIKLNNFCCLTDYKNGCHRRHIILFYHREGINNNHNIIIFTSTLSAINYPFLSTRYDKIFPEKRIIFLLS